MLKPWYTFTMNEFNSDVVTSTLRLLVDILKAQVIEYRLLGSVVIAAINGKLHRDLGDLDLMIDTGKKDILDRELRKLGYTPALGVSFKFARKHLFLETFDHPKLLSIGYFHGKWLPDGSFIMGDEKFNIIIDAYALEKTTYTLSDIKFIGVSKRAIATRIKSSRFNPKRKKELMILEEKNIQQFPDTYIHIHLLGIRTDWIYHLFKRIQNIIGIIRVKLGLPFDPWR